MEVGGSGENEGDKPHGCPEPFRRRQPKLVAKPMASGCAPIWKIQTGTEAGPTSLAAGTCSKTPFSPEIKYDMYIRRRER
jgi:hypothetical protein